MHVVVTGATGNVGSSLVRALSGDAAVDEITAIARRSPALHLPKVRWIAADVARDDLPPLFRGADAVVHLAWAIQPSHDEPAMRRINVEGSERVFAAAAAVGTPSLIHASSVGAYSPGPRDRRVEEGWPTGGIRSSFYSRHKVAVERALDEFETEHSHVRVVRLRPSLIFKRDAGSGVRRLFLGPLFPNALLRRGVVPVMPVIEGLSFQCVHADDIAEASRLALHHDVRGPFNLASEPVLTMRDVAAIFRARTIRVSSDFVRRVADLSWRTHLQPTPPGWLDMGMQVPLMSTAQAEAALGWLPRRSALEALAELLEGIRVGAGDSTPPLAPGTGGAMRARELATGIGIRSGANDRR